MNISKIIETEYENIQSHKIDKTIIPDNKIITKLRKSYEKILHMTGKIPGNCSPTFEEDYEKNMQKFAKKVKSIPYTQRDITDFCLVLQEYKNERGFLKTAFFISALFHADYLNRKKYEEPYLLLLDNLPPLDNLCAFMKDQKTIIQGDLGSLIGYSATNAEITINGKAEDFLGAKSKNTTIILNGNAKNLAGQGIDRGYLRINGNVGEYAGLSMENGYIIICGNAGHYLGERMSNGIIVLKGESKMRNTLFSVGDYMTGGTIIIEGNTVINQEELLYGGIVICDKIKRVYRKIIK